MSLLRSLLAIGCLLCGLAACVGPRDLEEETRDFNVAAERANNQQILLNLVRASQDRPVEWTHIQQFTGTQNLGGTLGLTANLNRIGGASPLTLSPSGTANTQVAPTVVPLDAREFYQYYIAPTPPEFMAVYLDGEINAYVYFVLVKRIEVESRDAHYAVENNPGYPNVRVEFRPTFADFEKFIMAFLDANLATEERSRKTKLGPTLKEGEAKAHLKEILGALTAKDSSVAIGEKPGGRKKETRGKGSEHNYELTQVGKGALYCFRAQNVEWRPSPSGTLPWTVDGDLKTFALARRCGATEKERDAGDQILKGWESDEPVDSPDLIVRACPKAQAGPSGKTSTIAIEPPGRTGGPDQLSDSEAYFYRYCKFVDDVETIANVHGPGPISIKIRTRSPEEVVKYLGQLAGFSYHANDGCPRDDPAIHTHCALVPEYSERDLRRQDVSKSGNESGASPNATLDTASDTGISSLSRCIYDPLSKPEGTGAAAPSITNWPNTPLYDRRDWCRRLLVVRQGQADDRAFVSVTYDGKTYWVPGNEGTNAETGGASMDVFELVHDLIAYTTVAKDLQQANIINVTPLP